MVSEEHKACKFLSSPISMRTPKSHRCAQRDMKLSWCLIMISLEKRYRLFHSGLNPRARHSAVHRILLWFMNRRYPSSAVETTPSNFAIIVPKLTSYRPVKIWWRWAFLHLSSRYSLNNSISFSYCSQSVIFLKLHLLCSLNTSSFNDHLTSRLAAPPIFTLRCSHQFHNRPNLITSSSRSTSITCWYSDHDDK